MVPSYDQKTKKGSAQGRASIHPAPYWAELTGSETVPFAAIPPTAREAKEQRPEEKEPLIVESGEKGKPLASWSGYREPATA